MIIKALKELGEGVGTMRPEEKDINKIQSEAGLLENGMEEVLFKEAHEQVGVGGAAMLGDVSKDELDERDKKLSGW